MSGKQRRGLQMIVMAILIILVVGLVYFSSNKNEIKPTLMVDQNKIQLGKEDVHHLFVIMINQDGSKKNVTRESQFITSDENIVTVNDKGVLTAINSGKADISVRYKEYVESVKVDVMANLPSVNVKDYGAAGDGMTNDTAAFQQAIDDMSQKGGGNVFIPEGTYSLHPLFLKPKTNLIGENREKVILKYADDAPDGYDRLITLNDYTKIQNLTCDGNYQKHPNGTEHMHCIFAYDNDHILIDNNRLVNAVGDGISISGSKEASDFVLITNNIVEENQRSQIVIEQVNHLRILNNEITSRTGRPGIHFEPWEEMQYYDAVITENTVTSNTDGYCVFLTGANPEEADDKGNGGKTYYFHGIEFYQNKVTCPSGIIRIIDTADTKLYDNIIDVNYIHVWRKNEHVNIYKNVISGHRGVFIEGGWEGNFVSTGTKIYGNTFYTLNEGVSIQEGAIETTIHNNTFSGSGKSSGIGLLALKDIYHVVVSENSFSNYKNGVSLDYHSDDDIEIREVKILKNQFKNMDGAALNVTGTVHHVLMDSNEISDASGVYIRVHEAHPISDIKIINNKIRGGEYGIKLTESGEGELKGLTIEGNHISNTKGTGDRDFTGAAIEIDRHATPPSNVSISNNVLINNERNFITVHTSLLDSVSNNRIDENE